jgi:hypothetical protein
MRHIPRMMRSKDGLMFRRLESLFAALGLFAAFGGAYYFYALYPALGKVNTWGVVAVAAAALTFLGISVGIHGHRAHTRLSVILGFLVSLGVALYVRSQYPDAQYAYVPETGLLLLTVVCAELRVFTKEPDNRKPEHVGAARDQSARRRRR